MKAVNRQIKIWQEREKGLNNQKEAEEKEKTMRKNEAEERKKKRASTFPTLSPQQKDVTDTAIDAIIAEETASAPTGGDGETEADPDEMQSTKVPDKQDDMQREEMEKRQEEKQRAREEDQGLYYTLISEAYIHGMMDGDAVREHILGGTEDEMRERLFEIR
ncbi:hypothetical protein PG989_015236 [Apiospora arundinis]